MGLALFALFVGGVRAAGSIVRRPVSGCRVGISQFTYRGWGMGGYDGAGWG